MNKPRLAIVSTLDDLCGIAGYSRYLAKQLADEFEVEIFDLDQFFMRATQRSIAAQADLMISEFAERFSEFDAVNLQLEYGIFGRKTQDVVNRFTTLARAAPNLSITFHTILQESKFSWGRFVSELLKFRVFKAWDRIVAHFDKRHLRKKTYGTIRKLQKQKPVSVIVHTRRDARLMKYVNKFDNVFDHPLAFISDSEKSEVKRTTSIEIFPQLKKLDEGSKLVAVFGFLGAYKGFDTAIKSLLHLPSNYHLAIFGGLHPNEIKRNVAIHPYVQKLLSLLEGDSQSVPPIKERVHFMGSQSDSEFIQAMAICDCAVFPYLEVGQSSSGPISMALEMDTPIVATRNHAFNQFSRYFPDFGENFEIGNYLELAEKIQNTVERPRRKIERKFTASTNAQMYKRAHSL